MPRALLPILLSPGLPSGFWCLRQLLNPVLETPSCVDFEMWLKLTREGLTTSEVDEHGSYFFSARGCVQNVTVNRAQEFVLSEQM